MAYDFLTVGDCLVYSTRNKIGKFCVADPQAEERLLLDGAHMVLSLDVDYSNKCVYHSDLNPNVVSRSIKVR